MGVGRVRAAGGGEVVYILVWPSVAVTSGQSSCAACSILSVLTQWSATLVIKLKGGDGPVGGGWVQGERASAEARLEH